MGLVNQPTGNTNFVAYAHSFQPANSATRVRLVETELYQDGPRQRLRAVRALPFLKWGDKIYLGVEDGLQFGVQIYNGHIAYCGYPTFVEGRPDHDGAPSEPEACTADNMWECQPYQTLIIGGFYHSGSRLLRPWQIVPGGLGYGAGEATFGTTSMNGLLDVYEKRSLGSGYRAPAQPNVGSYGGPPVTHRGGASVLSPESLGEPVSKGHSPVLGGGVLGDHDDVGKGHAAIGAGAAVQGGHVDTGVTYQHAANVVIQVNIELQSDLNKFLARQLGPNWRWRLPLPNTNWWQDPWSWQVFGPANVASEIPVAPAPHRRRG